MFSAACRTRSAQPRVIVTSTHGGIGVQDGLRLMKSADRRRVSVVDMDQWSAMADVMHLVVEYGHRSVLYFAGPKEWRDAATRLLAWNKLCAANAVNSVTVQCETWESSEAYGKMNHILDNIGRTGGNLPTCMVCANDSQAVGVARALHEHGVTFAVGIAVIELVGIAGPGYLGHFPADFRITHALTVAGRNFIEFRKLHDLAAWPVPAQIRGRFQRPAAR